MVRLEGETLHFSVAQFHRYVTHEDGQTSYGRRWNGTISKLDSVNSGKLRCLDSLDNYTTKLTLRGWKAFG